MKIFIENTTITVETMTASVTCLDLNICSDYYGCVVFVGRFPRLSTGFAVTLYMKSEYMRELTL